MNRQSSFHIKCKTLTVKLQNNYYLLLQLFRHGDRTPDKKFIYPNDPHINETYYPWGYGELTKVLSLQTPSNTKNKFRYFQKGQLKEYLLGKALRKRYDSYLGHYTPPAVEARSTNYNRTKASLELVLAGLYPPSETEIFYGKLRWQPIPFQYGASTNDWVSFRIKKLCNS